MKTVCCTGHRPKGFPWDYRDVDCDSHQEYLESLACYIDSLIRWKGFDYFICGGAIGADMDFADIVIPKNTNKNMVHLKFNYQNTKKPNR